MVSPSRFLVDGAYPAAPVREAAPPTVAVRHHGSRGQHEIEPGGADCGEPPVPGGHGGGNLGVVWRVVNLCRHHTLLSATVAGLITALYFGGFIVDVRAVLPHVIIFSTLLLMVTSICFSLLPSMRDRSYDQRSGEQWLESRLSYFRSILGSVLLSIAVVLVSLAALTLRIDPPVVLEAVLAPLGSFLFMDMLATSLSAFLVTFTFYLRSGDAASADTVSSD